MFFHIPQLLPTSLTSCFFSLLKKLLKRQGVHFALINGPWTAGRPELSFICQRYSIEENQFSLCSTYQLARNGTLSSLPFLCARIFIWLEFMQSYTCCYSLYEFTYTSALLCLENSASLNLSTTFFPFPSSR